MTRQRDLLWKLILRHLLPQFVKFFFPKKYDEIDWEKEPLNLDKELQTFQINSRPKNRIADSLIMLHLKKGGQMYIFLHIEIQGYLDDDFGLRVHQMSYRIEDKYGSNPVMLSVFTDDDPMFHPKEYWVETWGSGHLTFFNTYKVMEHHPNTYTDPEDIMSLIMETVYYSTQINKTSDDDIMKLFLPLVRKLLSKGYEKKYIYLVMSFIQAHVKFGNSENYRIFEEKIIDMEQYVEVEDLETFFDLESKLEHERQEKERERQEKERERQEKERECQEKERSVLLLISQNVKLELIAKILGVSVTEIENIQEKYKDNNPVVQYLNEHSEN